MTWEKFYWIFICIEVIAEESYNEIYEASNYGGQKYVLSESSEFLDEFNDRASSFKVTNLYCIFCMNLSRFPVFHTIITMAI